MNGKLTKAGYLQTREKLADLEHRLAQIEARTDLTPAHRTHVCTSYREMMRQYKREILLFEAENSQAHDNAAPSQRSV